jgi:WD40 repeat protein
LYHLAGLLAVAQRQDFVSQLPEDIVVKVMCFLPPKDLVAVQKVSRKWHWLGSNEKVWKQKCQEVIISVSVDKFSTWKELFRHNALTLANRQNGKCRVKRLPAHSQGILCCKVNGFQMATGSLDKTIMLWDTRAGRHLKTLTGHLRGVWSVAFLDQTLLVSGSHDHTIKVWNLQTSSCERTLMGHEGPVWTVAVKVDILVTGSQDKTVCTVTV